MGRAASFIQLILSQGGIALTVQHGRGFRGGRSAHRILWNALTDKLCVISLLGAPLLKALATAEATASLDLGCVAAHGIFMRQDDGHTLEADKRAATPSCWN